MLYRLSFKWNKYTVSKGRVASKSQYQFTCDTNPLSNTFTFIKRSNNKIVLFAELHFTFGCIAKTFWYLVGKRINSNTPQAVIILGRG